MKKVVITGCYGYIGRRLTNSLLQRGIKVLGVDVISNECFKDNPLFDFFSLELLEEENELFLDVDVLYHLAWKGVSTKDKNNYLQLDNISLTLKMLDFAKRNNVKKIVIPGSISEFSKSNEPVTGNEKETPSDLYAATKVVIRKLAYDFCNKNEIDLNWLLITSVFSSDRKDSNLLTYTITSLIKDEEVLCTKLEQKWDYIYISDLIDALIIIGEKGKKNHIYPIGSGRTECLSYYINYIARELKKEHLLRIGAIPYKNDFIDNSIVDIEELSKLGYTAKYSFEKAIRETIEFYKRLD